MEMRDSPPAQAVVVMDRFVSASSAQDAVKSLEQLVDAFKRSADVHSERKDGEISWEPAWIFAHEEIAEHLVWLLQHGTLRANESPCEEGAHLICQLYQYLIKSSDALIKPRPGVLLESLLDILDNLQQPVFLRVLALQLLEDVSNGHKSIAVNQWLQAPNGLHRIADLLAIDVENNPMEEAIRNQALIVAKSLAREAPMAKVFLFAEVDCKLLDLCWKEGGLTKGSPIVLDALELIEEVLKHADASLQDLVWQRPNVAPRLIQLLDLRGGEEFLYPKQRNSHSTTSNDANDDLDSILASGDGKPKVQNQVEDAPVPRLLPSEENVVKLVLNILRLLLETDSVRETVWKQQTGLCSIIWELALVSNPSNPPVCALPTASLQQEAMNLVADKFNDPVIMDRLSGLDRLLYLVCTGGGISDSFADKLGISQSALAILRQSLSGNRIHEILMRTLAPPPTEDENTSPVGPTVVQKLWNTVQENLNAKASEDRTLFLSGALGGLGLMLCDEQSREIMFKVAPISLDQISENLSDENEGFVKLSLLRFLCEWVSECPFIVHKLLCTTASTNLAGMATIPSDHQSLAHLLLGLSMEYLTKEEECGGWTRSGILQIMLKIGISKYTSSLEGLKTNPNQKMAWIVSEMEYKFWKKFCRKAVLAVRKRVVEELAAGSGDSDDDSDVKSTGSGSDIRIHPSNEGVKPLQKLLSQQAKELEHMAARLETAEAKVTSQESQLNTWRRRMESNPTELDHMLNEFTSKNSDLEEKVRLLGIEIERQKSEKDKIIKTTQEKLLTSEEETEKLRINEQEARDDLERTEQEMKALSQAYTSLEEEFRRQENRGNADARSGDISLQLQGQSSSDQNGSGSTEVTTLRSENTRLKNDARKADEWMSMAVQKMNEMGAANVELEKQLSQLNVVADNIQVENKNGAQEQQSLRAALENERALRLAAEQHLPHLKDLQVKLDDEQKKSQHLQQRVDEAENALLKYESEVKSTMQAKQQKVNELERLLYEAEEAAEESVRQLELEREALSTNTEAKTKRQIEQHGGIPNADLIDSSQILDEIRQSTQEEIYQLESVIRELKDRLGSDLGAYQVDDILARDEEIEELRKANDSAQEWMQKAVEHDNRKSSEIRKLSEQNASLLEQLEKEQKSQTKEIINSQSANETKKETLQEADSIREQFSALKVELEELKREKHANQGLLDELGIAMDDVAVMQQQLSEHKAIKAELESKLSGNALVEENDGLRSLNDELNKRLNEFEDWVQIAQTKIGELMAEKTEIESRLLGATKESKSLREENDALKAEKDAEAKDCGIDQLQEEVEKLKSQNDHLRTEKNYKERQYEDLQSQHKHLLESFTDLEQELKVMSETNSIPEGDLSEEEPRVEKSNVKTGHDHDEHGKTVTEIGSPIVDKDSADCPQAQVDENKATNGEELTSRSANLDEELHRSMMELSVTKDRLLSQENIAREWEGRASQLESELTILQNLMKEQESQTCDEITKWEENIIELEEKCAVLEENLKKSSETKDSVDMVNDRSDHSYSQLEKENASLKVKIDHLELSLAESSNQHTDSDPHDRDTIAELQEALKTAQDTIAKDEEVVRQWEERTGELELRIESLETDLRESEIEANEVIEQWQSSCAEAESKCLRVEEELDHLKATIQTRQSSSAEKEDDEDSYTELVEKLEQREEELLQLKEEGRSSNRLLQSLKDEVLALNEGMKALKEELEEEKVKAVNAVEEWTQKIETSHREKSKLETELSDAKSKIAELKETCSKFESNYEMASQLDERNRELSESISALKQQLSEQEQEAFDAVGQWQSACSDLEIKCADLELSVQQNMKTISIRDSSIAELRSNNQNHVLQIEKLKEKASEGDSALLIDLTNAKAEISKLLEQQRVEREEWSDNKRQIQVELKAAKEKDVEARDKIEKLSLNLEEISADSKDTVLQWTVRYDELNNALKDAQQQLKEQEIEANEAITVWETKTEELEKDLDVAEDQLLCLKDIFAYNSVGTEVNLVLATENLFRENTELNGQIETAKSQAAKSESCMKHLESENQALSESLSTSEKVIDEMRLKNDELAHQLTLKSEDKLEEERDRLIGIVAQLEEELREANSMLQACVTDESIDKASEFAASAIRDDVYSMRDKLHEYQQRFEDEKAARKVADLEIDRLHGDIATLLSLSDYENSSTNVKKLTAKSIEKLQKLEHLEIDELRKSLFRAIEELEVARLTEQNTNEALSKLRLQISMYEQEIISAKSEVNFLSEALEELRQAENSKRTSLEYRIGSLENENEVVRKYQVTELESLRNELAQMAMEKDLIVHQLKESEKTNASLVLAISNEENSESDQNPDVRSECVKLRIENAHLLTIAAEEKGKAERRLREQLSAQVASSELDVILEQELRLEAEAAVRALTEELNRLQNDRHSDDIQKPIHDTMENELKDLRSSLADVKEQNAKLTATLQEEASKAKETIDHLTDECRKAQAKALKFDRDTRTELAVQSEISKMRTSLTVPIVDKNSMHEDLIHTIRDGPSTNDYDTTILSAQAFDLIRKQQKEIQEERMMYSETLHEHEDLLALVAQQDLEKSCLREALVQVAGDAVANEALKKAEQFALTRYGNAVQVSN